MEYQHNKWGLQHNTNDTKKKKKKKKKKKSCARLAE